MSKRRIGAIVAALLIVLAVLFYWLGGAQPLQEINKSIAVPDTVKGE